MEDGFWGFICGVGIMLFLFGVLATPTPRGVEEFKCVDGKQTALVENTDDTRGWVTTEIPCGQQ